MKKYNSIKIISISLLLVLTLLISGCSKNNEKISDSSNKLGSNRNEDRNMNSSKISITINGETYIATLEDNDTSREFIKRLPLEIDMSELNGNEKYYYFEEPLPSSSKKVEKINTGDLMLYGSDCFVLFYESFNTTYSYTKIGRIDNPESLKNTVGNGNVVVSISVKE